jgi:hypothetical protein
MFDHIGFNVVQRSKVFYAAALAPPGATTAPRPCGLTTARIKMPAFVYDPDGHNVEAVTTSAA